MYLCVWCCFEQLQHHSRASMNQISSERYLSRNHSVYFIWALRCQIFRIRASRIGGFGHNASVQCLITWDTSVSEKMELYSEREHGVHNASTSRGILWLGFAREVLAKVTLLFILGAWWRIGRVYAFRPEGRGFESRSSRYVGTLRKYFACSCL